MTFCFISLPKSIGQKYFSKSFQSGSIDTINNIKTFLIDDEAAYYIAFNVCDPDGMTYDECSSIGRMDYDGNILVEKQYKWLDPNATRKSIALDEENIIILDALNGDPKIRLFIIDKYTLDSLQSADYDFMDSVSLYGDVGIIAYDDYYILSGLSISSEDPNSLEDWCIWIEKETLAIDTIMQLPNGDLRPGFEYLFIDENNSLTAYYTDVIDGEGGTRGFIKYNNKKEIVFSYDDQLDTETNKIYSHAALLQQNGNMVYKHKNKMTQFDLFNIGEFEIVSIDATGELNWVFDDPGGSPYGLKEIVSLSETNNGDILGCGYTLWHSNYSGIFAHVPGTIELPAVPDSIESYQAPYIIKLNGETGELIWQYSIIDTAYLAQSFAFSELYELHDGSLMGAGNYLSAEDYGDQLITSEDCWVVRLPANPCSSDTFECYVSSLLTNLNDFNSLNYDFEELLIFPNPSNGVLRIDSKYEIDKIEIHDLNGNTIIFSSNFKNQPINVSSLPQGFYILTGYLKSGSYLNSKFVKN